MARKEIQQINLNSDTRLLLKKLAKDQGISISAYIERLILTQNNTTMCISSKAKQRLLELAEEKGVNCSTYLEDIILTQHS